MARSRVVPALLVAVFGFFAAPPARAAYDAFRTSVRFARAVQLADGSVLPAGVYEFQINFAGTGKTAEFEFILPNGKHVKHAAEAVGFLSSATGGAGSGRGAAGFLKFEHRYYEWIKGGAENPLGEYKELKLVPQDPKKYMEVEGELKNVLKSGQKFIKLKVEVAGQASTESFSWSRAGFGANTRPTVAEQSGVQVVVVPSSTSPAFFRAQFPEAKPGRLK